MQSAYIAPEKIASGLILAVLGAIGFSGKAVIVKLAYRHGVDAVTLLMWRMALALPVFVLMAYWGGRGQPPLSRRDVLRVWGLGFSGYYLASYLDFAGLAYISASLERLILYLNPSLVMGLGVLLHQRRVSRRQGLGMAVSYAGVVLVFGREATLAGSHVGLGAALVLASAISYAIYLSASGQMVQRLGSLRLVGLASSAACVLCITQFLLLRPLSAAWVSEPVLWLSLVNATACTVAPVLMVMMAIERIGSTWTAQVGMVGPMSTLLLSGWLLGEPLTAWVLAGTALVLAGIFVLTAGARR